MRGYAPARTPAAPAETHDSSLRSAEPRADARSLKTAALSLLSRRDYTTSELRSKLAARGYSAEAIEPLVGELTASGVLDDRRVAAAHVRTAMGVKGRGRMRVARELAARGVPKDIIDEALSGIEAQDEASAVRKILTRKRWPARPTLAERRRMFQHLLRRGFPVDAIRRALGRDDSGADVTEE